MRGGNGHDVKVRAVTQVIQAAVSRGDLPRHVANPFRCDAETRREAERLVRDLARRGALPGVAETEVPSLLSYAIGLGPLEELIANRGVVSINVLDYDKVMVYVGGRWRETNVAWQSPEHLRAFATAIAASEGGVNAGRPVLELSLPDPFGRIQIDTTARNRAGVTIHIRRGRAVHISLDWMRGRTLSDEMADFLLELCVRPVGMVIVGHPGSGKTTLLEALIPWLPPVPFVVIDDQSEINVRHAHGMVFGVPPGGEDNSLFAALRHALRKNVSRIIVAEVRGPEAAQMVGMSHAATFWTTLHGTAGSFSARLVSLLRGTPPYTAMPRDEIERIVNLAFPVLVETSSLPQPDGTVTFYVSRVLMNGTLLFVGDVEDGRTVFRQVNEPRFSERPRYWANIPLPAVDMSQGLEKLLPTLRTRLLANPFDTAATTALAALLESGDNSFTEEVSRFLRRARELYQEGKWEDLSRLYGQADILIMTAAREQLPASVEEVTVRASEARYARLAKGNGTRRLGGDL